MRRLLCAAACAVLMAGVLVASAGAQAASTKSARPKLGAVTPGERGPLSSAAKLAMQRGPLPADADAYERLKARAAARAGVASAQSPAVVTPQPTIGVSKQGLNDPNSTPSDSTGAKGPTRYIETINRNVGIYDNSLNLINSDTLNNWWAQPGSNSFDPQVIWDPTTNRFYYAGDSVFSSTDNRLSYGFSKTASPNNATTDWCHYQVAYGSSFPDYPKLGDSKFFAIIGVNVFSGASFTGSDIIAIGKPGAGTTCPDPATFEFGIATDIMVGAVTHFTPVPANEIDTNKTGWVHSRPAGLPASNLGQFKVTRNTTTGAPIIQDPGINIPVASYTLPPNAPQKDGADADSTFFNLDTLDARLTQSVAGVDPSKGDKLRVWTQHAIAGGAGSQERWYEINPTAPSIVRTGNVNHGSLYVFNGAISPDRVVNGATKAFGRNMILGFTTSSATTFPAIKMVGKRGNDGVSSFKNVKSSPGEDEDFGCPVNGFCRWGDYAAATPDPNSNTGLATGRIFLTNMWTLDSVSTGETAGTSWRTWNWSARP